MNQKPTAPPIDLRNTEPVLNSEGGYLFKQGVIFRKISKFVTGTPEDQILPIPVFYDPTNGKVFTDNLRPELREEFEELYNKEDNK